MYFLWTLCAAFTDANTCEGYVARKMLCIQDTIEMVRLCGLSLCVCVLGVDVGIRNEKLTRRIHLHFIYSNSKRKQNKIEEIVFAAVSASVSAIALEL